ncbi:hypothetical protein LJC07_04750 [Christensenellaceae bacterium OttesenSCG-928-L17]|nr:hypothetical protein [Christensenellaceae bacterium OttesenSCG-928-L17]
MFIPNSFKEQVADTFYDKSVDVLDKTEAIDSEGGLVKTSESVKSTFKCNVRFTALGALQEEIGLVENIDIAITCSTDTAVVVDDILQYDGVKYATTDVLPYDSHRLIVGKKWQSE